AHPTTGQPKAATSSKSSYTALEFRDGRLPGHQGLELRGQPVRDRLLGESSPRQPRGTSQLVREPNNTSRNYIIRYTKHASGKTALGKGRAHWATKGTNRQSSL
ncbi:unnamed protein product, partial [Ixodes hexagonus]